MCLETRAERAEAGAEVAVNYLVQKEKAEETRLLIEQAGRRAILAQGDVSRSGEVGRMIEEIKRQLGEPVSGDYPEAFVKAYPELAGVVNVKAPEGTLFESRPQPAAAAARRMRGES